ncbi:unnamed protein product, partial [Wuchereria bancrofti]
MGNKFGKFGIDAKKCDGKRYDSDDSARGNYIKRKFVKTDGRRKNCFAEEVCYDQREPEAWCRLNENQSWTDKGCFCDAKLHSCVIERKNSGRLEYSYCTPQKGWKCYNSTSSDGGNGGDRNVHSGKSGAGRKYDRARGDYVKREFVETDGKKKECFSVEACYDQREPSAWCILNKNQSWTDKGCFCDAKLRSCVIERKNSGRLEYSYCTPQK